jgi:hypothetical protein
MTLDEGLLGKARDAGSRLVEAQRQALLSRAEYHTTIRRLHLGGASLRQIAEALSLSHQRVAQIVHLAGGSWWQRVWRTRSARIAVCTFCQRPPSEVSKLIAGPNVYICDSCVECGEEGRRGDSRSAGPLHLAKEGAKGRCSFCAKRKTERRQLLTGAANICVECLRACREILDGRRA